MKHLSKQVENESATHVAYVVFWFHRPSAPLYNAPVHAGVDSAGVRNSMSACIRFVFGVRFCQWRVWNVGCVSKLRGDECVSLSGFRVLTCQSSTTRKTSSQIECSPNTRTKVTDYQAQWVWVHQRIALYKSYLLLILSLLTTQVNYCFLNLYLK